MSSFYLSNIDIDRAVGELSAFFSRHRLHSSVISRLRLTLEEVLLQYRDRFGEDAAFELKTYRRFGSLHAELQVYTDSFDPFAEEDDELIRSLLTGLGATPVWRFRNGCNRIRFTASLAARSELIWILLSLFSAVILGFAARLLPSDALAAVIDQLLSPIKATVMGLLSAMSGLFIFFSVAGGICSMGDLSTFSTLGRKSWAVLR